MKSRNTHDTPIRFVDLIPQSNYSFLFDFRYLYNTIDTILHAKNCIVWHQNEPHSSNLSLPNCDQWLAKKKRFLIRNTSCKTLRVQRKAQIYTREAQAYEIIHDQSKLRCVTASIKTMWIIIIISRVICLLLLVFVTNNFQHHPN